MSMPRWVRVFWPELVLGTCWFVLVALGRTLFADDEMWQHVAIHVLQWVVVVGYAAAAFREHVRTARVSRTIR
jgi:hypothetical protein